MKEKDLISSIKNILNSSYIGDDCAYLKDLGIVVTQDSLVEDIHFSLETITPRQLGYKSVMVNVSDIAASGGECKYLTVSLSLPKNVDDNFVSEFYNGAKEACGDGIQIVGGDITGSDKVYISVCAIGKTEGRNISSRSNAKEGYKVVVAGIHGSSAAGLKLLLPSPEFLNSQSSLTNSTLSHRIDAVGEGKEKLFNMNASPEFVNSQSSLTNSSLSHQMDAVGEEIGYDCYIANYHDQGLIPIKTVAGDKTVNMTVGLDIVRTSPGHGTAFDIAGKNIARPEGMIEAIKAVL